ncbi:MAG: hypothetical protein AcusKO_11470 [Acuticoccus sp.]
MVATALVYINDRMSLLPTSDLLIYIEVFNARLGLPGTAQSAWVMHLLLGVIIFGLSFAVLQPILPGRGTVQGIWFGVILWLAMMLVFVPLTQHEIFGRDLGGGFAAVMLAYNLVYGAVLGMSYAAFGPADED